MIENIEGVITTILGLLSAGFIWIIRTVLTNKEQLQLQRQEGEQIRAALVDMKASMQSLREEILEIYKNK
ncbi:hypothetical protein UFOVP346_37 [uncultured Caudovirales phage]|uniref:Holin n=1 Tax=uncultured Caudovirales phage TaxID=2100421 RepID=A0A6J5M2W0_9CAUD|nr:hypothetical protein UFOVP346_37 [uncultured Caudovirales phage]